MRCRRSGAPESWIRCWLFSIELGRHSRRRVSELYGVKGLPKTYLLDKTGRIHFRAIGGREFDHPGVEVLVESLLRAPVRRTGSIQVAEAGQAHFYLEFLASDGMRLADDLVLFFHFSLEAGVQMPLL